MSYGRKPYRNNKTVYLVLIIVPDELFLLLISLDIGYYMDIAVRQSTVNLPDCKLEVPYISVVDTVELLDDIRCVPCFLKPRFSVPLGYTVLGSYPDSEKLIQVVGVDT